MEVKVKVTYQMRFNYGDLAYRGTRTAAHMLTRKIQYIIDGRRYQYEEVICRRSTLTSYMHETEFYDACIQILKDEYMIKKDVEASVKRHIKEEYGNDLKDLKFKQKESTLKDLLKHNKKIKFTMHVDDIV